MQAITGDSVLLKFEKARCALEGSLRRVDDIVPQSIGCQVIIIQESSSHALDLSLFFQILQAFLTRHMEFQKILVHICTL